MAATASHSFSFDPHHHLFSTPNFTPSTSLLIPKHPSRIFHTSSHFPLKSSSSSSFSTPTSFISQSPTQNRPIPQQSRLREAQVPREFQVISGVESESMWVRVMRSEELDITVGLLAESFAESML